jgi:hypothetical protein
VTTLKRTPRSMNTFLCAFIMLLLSEEAWADDLDIIVTKDAVPETRGEAYQRLTQAEFPMIAKKLAAQFSAALMLTGSGPSTKEPWKEARLADLYRVQFTLLQLWNYQLEEKAQRMEHVGLLLDLLEAPDIGYGRYLALHQIIEVLNHGLPYNSDKTPSAESILKRLDVLARDTRQPEDLRQHLLTVLFQYGDADKYFDLIIKLIADTRNVASKGGILTSCAPPGLAVRLTGENRRKYVRLSFEYIEDTNDGFSGHGYHLACTVGSFVGVKPVRDGQGSFAPDQNLPKYQDSNGLKKSFFQDTVNNALKWWAENNKNY